MTPEEHITDKRSFVVSLFEEAFGQTADEVLKNWDELTSVEMDGSKTNMQMAYRYAQEFKDELDFYGFMCFWLAIHNRWCKLPYYEEALKYCKQPDIKACVETNYNLAKSASEKESYDGLHPSAYGRIEGIEKIAGVYGRDDWTMHDAEVKSIVYDRDKMTLDIEVDTCIPQWAADGEWHIIPFHFSDVLSIEADLEMGNDYFWTTHFYADDNFIYVVFDSAHMKICARQLTIGDIL